jgi:hypothetical protein
MVNAAITADAMTHCLKITKPVVVLCDAPSADTLGPVLGKLKSLGVGEVRLLVGEPLLTVDLLLAVGGPHPQPPSAGARLQQLERGSCYS